MLKKAETDDVWKSYLLNTLATLDDPSKWLNTLYKRGYFEPTYNPSPIEISPGYFQTPYWDVLRYLENVSEYNKVNYDYDITMILLKIIYSIITYVNDEGIRIDNFRTDYSMIKMIFTLPVEYISDDHIEFIKIALNSKWDSTLVANELSTKIYPYLINNKLKDLAVKLLNILLDFKKDEKSYFSKYVSILGDYWLEELLTIKNDIYELCGSDAYKICLDKINLLIIDDESNEFSSILTIEDSSQNLSTNNYEMQLIFFMRDYLLYQDSDIIYEDVKKLINNPKSIFKRLALNTINLKYEELKDIFWTWKVINPIEIYSIKHELYELLSSNCRLFNGTQLDNIITWIENEDLSLYERHYEDDIIKNKAIAYHKKEWLSSVLPSNNKKITALYDKYDKINPEKVEHPGHKVWTSGIRVIPEPDSFENEILQKENALIAEFLMKPFEPKTKYDREDRRADSFRRSVKENSIKFSSNLNPFFYIPREFQYSLLSGLYDAWKAGEVFTWNELFDFILKLIINEDFWAFQTDTSFYSQLIVQKIAELIEIGTKDDSHAFNESLLPNAESILLLLASKDKSQITKNVDLINTVLNSPKGAIYSAMINYSLRYKRLKKDEEWAKNIKKYFDKCIQKKIEQSIEFFVIIGQYLPNIYYLDSGWVNVNISNILPKDNNVYWNAAFTGYLFSSTRLYKALYDIIKENNHYEKGLYTDFVEEYATRKLVQIIILGYLNGFEDIKDDKSLISKLISRRNPDQLLPLVNFIWRIYDKLDDIHKEKILPLWNYLIKSLQDYDDDPEIQKVFSSMIYWINFVDELDDTVSDYLKFSARHIEADYNSIFLIEKLRIHVEKTPKIVGELFNETLNSGTYPFYKVEDIQYIVSTLYERGEKQLADQICEQYWNKKIFFLKEIYDEYQD